MYVLQRRCVFTAACAHMSWGLCSRAGRGKRGVTVAAWGESAFCSRRFSLQTLPNCWGVRFSKKKNHNNRQTGPERMAKKSLQSAAVWTNTAQVATGGIILHISWCSGIKHEIFFKVKLAADSSEVFGILGIPTVRFIFFIIYILSLMRPWTAFGFLLDHLRKIIAQVLVMLLITLLLSIRHADKSALCV